VCCVRLGSGCGAAVYLFVPCNIYKGNKMSISDVEIIVGTYEEFLLGYKVVKKGNSVSIEA
jgi:hypothetical protein